MMTPSLMDIVGPEYTKLGFFREVQEKIAQLHAYTEELELKKQEIQSILDGIMDVLAVITPQLRIQYVNPIFFRYFDDHHPQGKLCYEVFRGSHEPCAQCPVQNTLITGKPDRITSIHPRGDRSIHFELIAAPIRDEHGATTAVLLTKRDITLEKEYQAKYTQAEKMATIGMLAAGVAHEINNPLASISGFAEAISRRLPQLRQRLGPDDPMITDLTEYLGIIADECSRCRDIVLGLLSFSRQPACAGTRMDLNSLVRDTLKILSHKIKEVPGVRLVDALAPAPITIAGDPSELKQVILNLVLNALDAVRPQGTITVRVACEEGFAVLSVEDDGHGIPPEIIDKLFLPFFTTKTQGHSIGIGLSICYGIIEQHGGDITVCSSPGQGATFRVRLPLDHPQPHASGL